MNDGGGYDGRLGNKVRLVIFVQVVICINTKKRAKKDKRNFNLVKFMRFRLDNETTWRFPSEIRKTT